MKKMKNAVMRTLGLRNQAVCYSKNPSWFWMLYHHM
ncbi:hypothetical protein EDC28_103325 [Gallaecimonas pentaromativorans]|uniref:Uncharacterized protein n=1 Tax=Gallaecimonas pentaromativorans TaxID=584787 RepID=A0A3N1PNM9_9GAMM|nr:hypothetical protein EDC28_103325 [Gallaecimonas pentaromativorans]